ncbi:AfsA-related hotdog domain-containing protein [Streptomyces sp. NPDC020298]|uniref:AfsA-related hotdog domain-containing protein n=1 Tax=unclassified Streptomyces TaxID=2593676 RepID=UPI0033FCC5DF
MLPARTLTGTSAATPSVISPPSVNTWTGAGERRTSRLYVDETHPFFFDHPVDHVPAMLLVAGLLDLAAPPAHALHPGNTVRLSLRVPRMAELNAPVTVSAQGRAAPHHRWQVRVAQHDTPVADGELEYLTRRPALPRPTRTAPSLPDRADRTLVHRHRPENVLIGHAHIRDEWLLAPLRTPGTDHYLTQRHPVAGSIEELVEAGRQFGILYGHVVQGRPADSQILLLGMTAELPVTLPPRTPVTLRSVTGPGNGSRGRLTIDYLAGGTDGTRVGEMALDYIVVSAAAYRRMRAARTAS